MSELSYKAREIPMPKVSPSKKSTDHLASSQDKNECIWNVFRYNINSRRILAYNVFSNYRFAREIVRLREHYLDLEEFSKELLSSIRYCFWARSEYEYYVTGFDNSDSCEKISIYDQLMLNFYAFAQYTWTHYNCIDVETKEVK